MNIVPLQEGLTISNADTADYLLRLSEAIREGRRGEMRQVVVILEADRETDIETFIIGKPCDRARLVGLVHYALHKFMREEE